jgi:PPK2 family polyphosphate:nucleotide phosphotransferase
MPQQPIVPPFNRKVSLKDYDPDYTGSYEKKDEIEPRLTKDLEKLARLQETLYAEGKQSLLVILQAIDTGGKDGTIRHIFRGVNPQGVQVTSFKQPSVEELSHDFLWRIHQKMPQKGIIGIFNRSHYEDVLVVRVHNLVPERVWRKRYEIINDFERALVENGTAILKLFLHISKDEQKVRLEDRRQKPHKNWKFSANDVKERELWDEYMKAFEGMLTECHTSYAPWHIIPANHNWYRNSVVGEIIVDTLESMKPSYPKLEKAAAEIVIPD